MNSQEIRKYLGTNRNVRRSDRDNCYVVWDNLVDITISSRLYVATPKLAVVAEYSPGSVESIFINNQEITIIFSSGYQTISKSSLIE